MRPRLLPALAPCSLACSVALTGLWVRSWWRADHLEYVRPASRGMQLKAYVEANRGVATFEWRQDRLPLVGRPSPSGFSTYSIDYSFLVEQPPAWDALLGFSTSTSKGATSFGPYAIVLVPLWPAILLTAVPPAVWAWRRRRRGTKGFEVGVAAERPEGTDL